MHIYIYPIEANAIGKRYIYTIDNIEREKESKTMN